MSWERDFDHERERTVGQMTDHELLAHGRRLVRLGVHRDSEAARDAIGEAIARGMVPGVPARPRPIRVTVVLRPKRVE